MAAVAVLALALAGPISAQTPPSSSATPLVAQIVSLQEKGDDAAAKRLVSRNAGRLGVELTTVLEEIDRDFDDMSRQKARSDVLEKRFDQLESALVGYDKVFRLYRQVTGNQKSLRSFQAKALRIEGARRTTRGDMLWDRLEYAQALEEYSSAIAKLQEAIPLARLVEDQKLIGSCLNNIGYAAISKGNKAEGLRNYSEALKLAEHRKDDVYRGLYNLNMGVFYLSTGKPRESLRYSLAANALTQKTGQRHGRRTRCSIWARPIWPWGRWRKLRAICRKLSRSRRRQTTAAAVAESCSTWPFLPRPRAGTRTQSVRWKTR